MHYSIIATLQIAPLVSYVIPTIAHPYSHPSEHSWSNSAFAVSSQDRARTVKAMFETAWNGYHTYAFPNDELLPVNNSFGNSRNGWGASAIDALSTAIIMQNTTIVDEILAHVPTINFGISFEDEQVSLFETTIRYLGGLLSAYDLLQGSAAPYVGLEIDRTKVGSLIDQAVNLANNLSYAFETATGIPFNNLILSNRSNDGAETNGIATIGTLVLEWTHLSDITGNTTYAELAQKAESYLLAPQSVSGVIGEPFPGLLGTSVNITNGLFIDGKGGWNGGDDSFYEYLLKMYLYDSKKFGTYKDRWITAAQSTIQFLASHPSSRPDITFIAGYNQTSLTYRFSHLGCFAGGNFLLGGLVLDSQDFSDFGLAVTSGCHQTYISTATGIGPEVFNWTVSGDNSNTVPANQTSFYQENGFIIDDPEYVLRPEVMESYYYAYRATGDTKYQDWAWEAVQAIASTTRAGSGYAEIKDVNTVGGGGFTNFQESFLFAEVLKYAYLIFAGDDGPLGEIQVQGPGGKQGWVFNTEAHPLKVVGVKV